MRDNLTGAASGETIDTHGMVSPYLIVTKPGIVVMVLIATLSGMYIAGGEPPDGGLVFWTLLGIGLASAGAATLNNWWDRDIDRVMERTRGRPVASGALGVANAAVFGLALCLLSVAVSALFVSPVVAALNLAAILCYVGLYTMWSKRRTPLATFIGGAGGALPPVVGYAAVKPEPDLYALTLFLIIFAWQHPHFWSLSLKYIDEYRRAGVRNHPVVLGVEATKRRIALWAAVLALVSFLPYVLGMAGYWYLAVAAALGAAHVAMAVAFLLSGKKLAMGLFYYSLVQLPILFLMILVDLA